MANIISSPAVPPINRLKFFCSHGGRILPCPPPAHLKYIGGHTRLISVPTHISFQELMKRLTSIIDGEMILKYQVAPEDLDALITVKSDKDLHHMMEEIEHYEAIGAPRLRAFLFPSIVTPVVDAQKSSRSSDLNTIEQHYIEAINGSIWLQHDLSIHSPMPPRSPNSHRNPVVRVFRKNHCQVNVIHKVKSSPTLSNNNNNGNFSHHLVQHIHGNTSPKPWSGRPMVRGDGTLRIQVNPEGMVFVHNAGCVMNTTTLSQRGKGQSEALS